MTQQPSKWTRPSPTIRVGVLGLFAAFLLVLPLALAPRAEAYIYWANGDPSTLDRPRQPRRHGGRPELHQRRRTLPVRDIAVDAKHIYWTQTSRTPKWTIGRAKLDGTGVDRASSRRRVAVRAQWSRGSTPDHVYWTTSRTRRIGRANLDGTGVDQSFIAASALRTASRSTRPHLLDRLCEPARTGSRPRSAAPTSTARRRAELHREPGFTA